MITFDFEQRGKTTLCDWIYSSIKKQICDGSLSENEKLPSKRALSQNLGVSVITVQNAYARLIDDGFIYSVEKKGFFVSGIINFAAGGEGKNLKNHNFEKTVQDEATENGQNFFTDFTSNSTSFEKFPFGLWAKTLRQVLNSGDEKLLLKNSAKGVFELRLAIAEYLFEFRGMHVLPQQIVIGSGTESLYTMIVQLLGRDKVFALENPGYHKAGAVFKLNGAQCVPVPLDTEGINLEFLETSGADVLPVSPNHNFPTGIVTSARRRQEILAWANKSEKRWIIEDDYDSEFRFNGKPLPPLQSIDCSQKVIYINTFTKTLAPSLRISYMVLPESLKKEFEERLGFFACPVSSFEQFTLARFISEGNYEKHIVRMKNFYKNLRNELIGAIKKSDTEGKFKIYEKESGLHFLLSVESEEKTEVLEEKLKKNGINIKRIDSFYYGKNYDGNEKTFVVNYSGIKKEKIEKTIKLIKKSLF